MQDTKQLRVTVIIPVYNGAKFILDAIESVWQQNFANLELIVIDDGSTDATPQILRSIQDQRLHIVRTENQGVAKARNEGLSRAQGEYIAFLDADDIWHEDKLRRQVKLLDAEPDIGVVFTNFTRFDAAGTAYAEQFEFYPEIASLSTQPSQGGDGYRVTEPAFAAFLAFDVMPGYTQTMLFRRSIVAGISFRYPLPRGPKLEYLEDMDFCLRCFRLAPVAFIRDVLVKVRRHDTNLTRDFQLLPKAKIVTWQLLAEETNAEDEASELHTRIGREWVSLGRYYARQREPFKALNAYYQSARHKRWRATLGALIRFPLDLARGPR